MTRQEATILCKQYQIDTAKEFYTLSSTEIGRVLDAAKLAKYRRPKNANGSKARYFFEALRRAMERK